MGDVRQREEEHLEQKVVHCSGGIARRRGNRAPATGTHALSRRANSTSESQAAG